MPETAEALDLNALIQQSAADEKAALDKQIQEQADFDAQAKADLTKARAAKQPAIEELQKRQAAVEAIEPPRFTRPPEAPNTQEMLQPSSLQKTFGMASIFGLLAVGLAKGSAIYGLKALGGFMKGAHEGNIEQASAALKDFTAKMQEVHAANEATSAEYNAIFNNKKYDFEMQDRMTNIKAAEFRDELMQQAAAQGGMNAKHKLLQDRAKVGFKMSEELLKMRAIDASLERTRMIGQRAAGATNTILGIPKEDIPAPVPGQINQAFLDMLNPADREILTRMIKGDLPVSGFGGLGVKQREQYLMAAPLVDPNFNAGTYGIINKTRQELTPGGPVGANVLAINTLAHHIDDYAEQFAKLNNSQVTRWNSVKNKFATEFGDPALNRLKVPLGLVAAETARVVKGGRAAPTEDEIKYWEGTFDTAASPAQAKQVVWQALQGVGGRLKSIEDSVEQQTGRPYSVLTPDARALILKNKPKDVPTPDWLKEMEGRAAGRNPATPSAIEAKQAEQIKEFQRQGYEVSRNKQTGKLGIRKGNDPWQILE